MSALPPGAVLRESGETAFVLEFGDSIDLAASRTVAALAAALDRHPPDGLVETVPTFRSLLVLYDPDRTDRETILAALSTEVEGAEPAAPTRWRLPVCLEAPMAEDLADAARALELGEEEVREALVGANYQVGMYGFAPGFAYLSGVDPKLAIPRRKSPRPPMPKGSLIIAGGMAALTSVAMPTGWYVVGRTAIELFRPDAAPIVPFSVGDQIAFTAASQADLDALSNDPDGGLERLSS